MIRKFALLTLMIFLNACASGQHDGSENGALSEEGAAASPQNNNDGLDEVKKPTQTPVAEAQARAATPIQVENDALKTAIRANDYDSIYRSATSVLSKNPNDVRALNALGLYHFKKGHHAAAMLMYDRALKVNPGSGEVHNNIGLALLAQKEQREAIQEFRKALAINSDDWAPAANLGSIYVEHKTYTKALVANEIAYKKNSKDIRILNNYGVSLTGVGKYSEAKEIFKKAMALNGENKDVMMNYAILLIDFLKENGEGLDLLNKARFLGLSPEARNRMNVLENKAKSGVK